MGKLAVYKYFSFMILVVTVMAAFFTFIGLIGGYANPAERTAMAMIVYVLPIFILIDIVTLLFYLLRRLWHWAAIPFVTLICCIPYIGTIYKPSFLAPSNQEVAGINIASYNVALFGREITGFKAEDILSEMKEKQKVDILCIQEYKAFSGDKDNTSSYLAYFNNVAKGRDDMVIFSRYPVKNSGTIDFGVTNNSAMWADVDINGKMLRIFNVHLETTGFNRTLHKAAKQEMQGSTVEKNALISAIYGNYTRGMVVRARQADLVAQVIKESKYPVVVCGDFNDVPYSYTYNTMKGDLIDGFKECGSGFMSTFRGKKAVRIDYIFHDEALKGLSYYKNNLSFSDHNPVFMKLAY